mmetsp:Transcript_15531/g.33495  ORF Transcript_15531/g.33495 Transcript_15531/m.33495 type:complete len:253 (-) Transcript_15531:1869-2627(-)
MECCAFASAAGLSLACTRWGVKSQGILAETRLGTRGELGSTDGTRARLSSCAVVRGDNETKEPVRERRGLVGDSAEELEYVRARIVTVMDFPKRGIRFRDVLPALSDPEAFQIVVAQMFNRYAPMRPTHVCGIDARGFILGAALASKLNVGFVALRKGGKLPGATHRVEYELEYGSAALELDQNSLDADSRVVVVDDLIATGGSMMAACALIAKAHASVLECCVLLEFMSLGGRSALSSSVESPTLHSLLKE